MWFDIIMWRIRAKLKINVNLIVLSMRSKTYSWCYGLFWGNSRIVRSATIALICCIFSIMSWVIAPTALALTQIKLYDLDYKECPPELAEGNVTSGEVIAANCFIITGKAKNPSGKPVVDADVYGRIYDANNNPVFQNRGRVGTIVEVPPGVSDFEIRISVAANQPTPLQLKQFKASGFAGRVRPFYYDD